MGLPSLNENSSLINQQIESQEKLGSRLIKLQAFVRLMGLIDEVEHIPSSVLHGCFLLAEDLVEARFN